MKNGQNYRGYVIVQSGEDQWSVSPQKKLKLLVRGNLRQVYWFIDDLEGKA